ncbi:MAG TPA: DCC1-like thiol-disulfide oxidoreductase family protein [Pseudonocardiaceae bacterium]|jgi:predicted DCC family thiol-disulfide oxidoreductase YuxK|nr:DCC1-like thiol-disulfide oxidoreductase family protein [Pseudonocardiaceae bacterium]
MRPVFLYDGDCGFCARFVRWANDRPVTAATVPWQGSDLTAAGLSTRDVEAAVWWIEPGAVPVAGPVAIGRLLATAGGCWRIVGPVLGAPPVRWLAWPVYRLIARYRHRLPGGTPACALPGRGD